MFQIRCFIRLLLGITFAEFLYGVLNISNDVCDDPDLSVDISFWFILKACITVNVLVLLYTYTYTVGNHKVCSRKSTYNSIWVLLSFHCMWLIIGAQIFWRPCANEVAPILVWVSVLIGVLTFIGVIKMLSLIDLFTIRNQLNSDFNIA